MVYCKNGKLCCGKRHIKGGQANGGQQFSDVGKMQLATCGKPICPTPQCLAVHSKTCVECLKHENAELKTKLATPTPLENAVLEPVFSKSWDQFHLQASDEELDAELPQRIIAYYKWLGRQENIEAAQREVQSNITALHKQIADLLERLSAVTYKEGKAQAELARERASKIRLKEQHALDLHTMQQKFDELQETVSNKAAAITGGREWYSKPARKR